MEQEFQIIVLFYMLNKSRIDIYDYVAELFKDVTSHIHKMDEPTELTEDEVNNGFLVIHVSGLRDYGEFDAQAYGSVRAYVTAYVPTISRGRVKKERYRYFENAINGVIEQATSNDDGGTYYIEEDSIVSSDDMRSTNNAGNEFFQFIKSFVVIIDEQS